MKLDANCTKELISLLPRLPIPYAKAYLTRLEWLQQARKKQIPDQSNWWKIWLTVAGRGYGKTRQAVEDIWWWAWNNPRTRTGVVCATAFDTRQTAFEGESGFITTIPQECYFGGCEELGYKSNILQIKFLNGSIIQGYSAEKPGRLRGPSFHRVWADELAIWRYPETFDMINFALRLGINPQLLITTTPQPIKLLKELVQNKNKDTLITTGSTFENKENLAATALEKLLQKYEGTRLGRQELYAEILEDVEGALWTNQMIEICLVIKHPMFQRIVIAIDPATKAKKDSDETGIIIAGLGEDKFYYILDDLSGKHTPNEWANIAITAYDKYGADKIVGETNQGGDMVETIIRNIRPDINFAQVHATKGKYVRAEPIAALYEQKKVKHIKIFKELNEQLTGFVPGVIDSPDRLDALVWALTELALPENQKIMKVWRL